MDLDLEPINLKPFDPMDIDLKGFENVELKPLEYIPFNMFDDVDLIGFDDVELKPIDDIKLTGFDDIDLDLSNFNLTWQ